jgi:hypothetical protein
VLKKLGWVVTIILLFVGGALGLNNAYQEIASAASRLQLSVNLAQILYGATGIAAAVGLAMRKRWSVRATIASCVAMTYTGSVASFAYHDPGFKEAETITGTVSAFLSLILVSALMIWIAHAVTREQTAATTSR